MMSGVAAVNNYFDKEEEINSNKDQPVKVSMWILKEILTMKVFVRKKSNGKSLGKRNQLWMNKVKENFKKNKIQLKLKMKKMIAFPIFFLFYCDEELFNLIKLIENLIKFQILWHLLAYFSCFSPHLRWSDMSIWQVNLNNSWLNAATYIVWII